MKAERHGLEFSMFQTIPKVISGALVIGMNRTESGFDFDMDVGMIETPRP